MFLHNARGPWNQAADFDYIESPEPMGGLPPAPINPDDERPIAAVSAKPKRAKAHA